MSDKPRLLDLYSGAGGAGVGYTHAGFEVVGVDLHKQKNYPYEFHQGDALAYVAAHGHEYDAIHASPMCQVHSNASRLNPTREHIDLIPQTRYWLQALGKPYIIENVKGARKLLHNPIMLCGCQFGLKTYRPRYFESNVYLSQPKHYPHDDNTPPVGKGKSAKGFFSLAQGGIPGVTYEERRIDGMGVDWVITNYELSQAIPPAFTHYIGLQLINYLNNKTTIPVPATPDFNWRDYR